MDGKVSKLGKLYGNPVFTTGPAGSKAADAGGGHNAKGTFASGPNKVAGDIGHKAKGTFASGVGSAQKGMTSGGSASGKRGNVKA